MTEHFTSKEAVAVASTIAEDDDYEFNLVNAAVTAKLKEWEAQGAVAKSIRRIAAAFFAGDDRGDRAAARAIMAMEVEANKFLTSDATHALPAQPAEPVNAELVAALEQTQGEAKSDLRGIDAGPFSEWLDLVRHGHVNRDECLIMVKDIPKWLKQNPQATEPAPLSHLKTETGAPPEQGAITSVNGSEPAPIGCDYCTSPLYAGTKCKSCRRVNEPAPSTAGGDMLDLLAVAKDFVSAMENCSLTSGVCCCGDEMSRHGSPESCGHVPVDSGAYFAESALRNAYNVLERIESSGLQKEQQSADGFTKALEIRTKQSWRLNGEAIPVLYTDTINDQQVMRDDVWLCTTSALKSHKPTFPTMLRKMWSGGEVQEWIDTNWSNGSPAALSTKDES